LGPTSGAGGCAGTAVLAAPAAWCAGSTPPVHGRVFAGRDRTTHDLTLCRIAVAHGSALRFERRRRPSATIPLHHLGVGDSPSRYSVPPPWNARATGPLTVSVGTLASVWSSLDLRGIRYLQTIYVRAHTIQAAAVGTPTHLLPLFFQNFILPATHTLHRGWWQDCCEHSRFLTTCPTACVNGDTVAGAGESVPLLGAGLSPLLRCRCPPPPNVPPPAHAHGCASPTVLPPS